MQGNYWTVFEDNRAYYYMDVPFSKKDALLTIQSFCADFFSITAKYEILTPNQLSKSPIYQRYINNYDDYLSYCFKLKKLIYPLTISEIRMRYDDKMLNYPSKMSFYDKQGRIIDKVVRFLDRKDNLEVFYTDAEDLAIFAQKHYTIFSTFSYPLVLQSWGVAPHQLKEENRWLLSIKTFSNIWLDQVFLPFKIPNIDYEDYEWKYVDNRALAYRHTPRLNSFLRDLKALVLKYGGEWGFNSTEDWLQGETGMKLSPEEDSDKLWCDCGIPLDGKIIYQEDIESGDIKIPS